MEGLEVEEWKAVWRKFVSRVGDIKVRNIVAFLFVCIILYLIRANEEYALIPKFRLDMDVDMFANRRYPTESEILPLPIVTDLESDGVNEVVVVTNEFKLQIYAADVETSSYVLPEPRIRLDVQLPLNVSEDGRVSRPVAMATGYLLDEEAAVPVLKQAIAMVTDDWTVLCYNHKLKLMWRTQLMNIGQTRDNFYIKSMQIHVASIKLQKRDSGLILIGGRYAHKVHKQSNGQLFGDDGLDQKSGTQDQDDHSLSHFTTFALSATDGAVRWHHLPTDFKQKQHFEKDVETAHHWKLALKRGHLHKDEKPWTHYKYDFLKILPHSWTMIQDTRFELANIKRSSHSESNSEPPPVETSTISSFINIKNPFQDNDDRDVNQDGGGRSKNPNSLVIHSDQGIEVLNLVSGQPITKLSLPAGQQTYADLDGDGEIEELVKKVHAGTIDEGTDCDAVVSKFKQSEIVFRRALCDPGEFSLYRFVTGKENFVEDPIITIPPVVTGRISKRSGFVGMLSHLSGDDLKKKHRQKDLLFVIGSGVVASYGLQGEIHWMAKTQSKWSHMSRVSVDDLLGDDSTKEIYRNAFKPTATALSLKKHGQPNALLVTGWDMLSLVDLKHGYILGAHKLPCVPNNNIVLGDFDNNGWTDVIVSCPSGYLGFSINPSTNWVYSILLKFGVVLGIASLYWFLSPEDDEDESYDDDENYG